MRAPDDDRIIIKRDADGHYVYFSMLLSGIPPRAAAIWLGNVRFVLFGEKASQLFIDSRPVRANEGCERL
jgi:hypothetical protein